MKQNVDNAQILIRVLGILCIVLGAFGTLYAVIVLIARSVASGELIDTLWADAAGSLVSGPYWMLLGATILALSPRLARVAAKSIDRDAP